MDQNLIYKILPLAEWTRAKEDQVFRGCGIDIDDGFIHLSSADQVAETLARYFAGQTNLVIIGVEEKMLGETLRWEASREGPLFPHVYGNIPLSAVSNRLSLGSNYRRRSRSASCLCWQR